MMIKYQAKIHLESERIKDISVNKNTLAAVSLFSGHLKLFSLNTFQELANIVLSQHPIRTSVFVPGLPFLISASDTGELFLVSLKTYRVIQTQFVCKDFIRKLVVHANYLFAACDDRTVKLFQFEKSPRGTMFLKKVCEITEYENYVMDLFVCAEKDEVVSLDLGGKLHTHRLSALKSGNLVCLQSLRVSETYSNTLCCLDRNRVLVGCDNGKLVLVELEKKRALHVAAGLQGNVTAFLQLPGGVAIGTETGELVLLPTDLQILTANSRSSVLAEETNGKNDDQPSFGTDLRFSFDSHFAKVWALATAKQLDGQAVRRACRAARLSGVTLTNEATASALDALLVGGEQKLVVLFFARPPTLLQTSVSAFPNVVLTLAEQTLWKSKVDTPTQKRKLGVLETRTSERLWTDPSGNYLAVCNASVFELVTLPSLKSKCKGKGNRLAFQSVEKGGALDTGVVFATNSELPVGRFGDTVDIYKDNSLFFTAELQDRRVLALFGGHLLGVSYELRSVSQKYLDLCTWEDFQLVERFEGQVEAVVWRNATEFCLVSKTNSYLLRFTESCKVEVVNSFRCRDAFFMFGCLFSLECSLKEVSSGFVFGTVDADERLFVADENLERVVLQDSETGTFRTVPVPRCVCKFLQARRIADRQSVHFSAASAVEAVVRNRLATFLFADKTSLDECLAVSCSLQQKVDFLVAEKQLDRAATLVMTADDLSDLNVDRFVLLVLATDDRVVLDKLVGSIANPLLKVYVSKLLDRPVSGIAAANSDVNYILNLQ